MSDNVSRLKGITFYYSDYTITYKIRSYYV